MRTHVVPAFLLVSGLPSWVLNPPAVMLTIKQHILYRVVTGAPQQQPHVAQMGNEK